MTINIPFIVFPIFLLLILWGLSNFILKKIGKNELNLALTDKSLTNRKNIMFQLISICVLFLFNFKILNWIALIYYGIISIIEFLLLLIALVTGIAEDYSKKEINKKMWLLLISNFLTELSYIIAIISIVLTLKL